MSGTFTCDDCGETFDKTRSDEEADAEAQKLFPGIDVSDPEEAGIVCDDCFNRIMARARAEAPELIGEGWRDGQIPVPVPVRNVIGDVLNRAAVIGYDAVPLAWPEGRLWAPFRDRIPRASRCYQTASGFAVHVQPNCRCRR